MRALITGSAGFVGRHIEAELRSRGWDTAGVDLVPTATTFGCDAREIFRSETEVFALVVHCAFHVGGRAAIDGEPRLLARNLELDSAMFDWAVRTRQKRVLYFSSSAAYPIGLQSGGFGHALHEDNIDLSSFGQPDARYGWAKLTGEHLAAAARESGLKVTVVRPFSGYGEDQSEDYPFRAMVERAKARVDPFVVWGPGTQVRDWIHVDDVVAGALAVVESGTEDPVNLCTGIGTSMFELARMCCDAAGYKPEITPLPDKPTGVAYRVGDPSRFQQYWTPRVSIEEGVERAFRTKYATGGFISTPHPGEPSLVEHPAPFVVSDAAMRRLMQ